MNDDIALRNARAFGFLDALLNISDRSIDGERNKLSPGLERIAREIVSGDYDEFGRKVQANEAALRG